MTRTRVFIGGTAMVLGLAMVAAPGALAGTSEPGLLQASDVPGSVELVREPETFPTVYQFVINADTCVQTFEVDDTAVEYTGVVFAATATGDTALSEVVIIYPDAKTAKAAFKYRASTTRAGVKCGTVENVAPGAPSSILMYDKVKFPKIGGGSDASARDTADLETAAVSVELVSGPYVVLLSSVGNGEGPTVKELKAIARKAEKRLNAAA